MVVYSEGCGPVFLIKPARFVGEMGTQSILLGTVMDGWITGLNFQKKQLCSSELSSSVIDFFSQTISTDKVQIL